MTQQVKSVFKKKTGAKRRKTTAKNKKTSRRRKASLPVKIIASGRAALGAPGTRRKRSRHLTRHHSKHLSGVADVLGIQNPLLRKTADGFTQILLIGSGVVVGGLIGKGIDKILKVDETTTGWKKWVKPITLAGGGVVGAIFLKPGQSKEDVLQGVLRKISIGVGISGAVSVVDMLTGKSLLGSVGISGADADAVRAEYYKTAEETMKKIQEAQNYKPRLKGDDDDESENTMGLGTGASDGGNEGTIF